MYYYASLIHIIAQTNCSRPLYLHFFSSPCLQTLDSDRLPGVHCHHPGDRVLGDCVHVPNRNGHVSVVLMHYYHHSIAVCLICCHSLCCWSRVWGICHNLNCLPAWCVLFDSQNTLCVTVSFYCTFGFIVYTCM